MRCHVAGQIDEPTSKPSDENHAAVWLQAGLAAEQRNETEIAIDAYRRAYRSILLIPERFSIWGIFSLLRARRGLPVNSIALQLERRKPTQRHGTILPMSSMIWVTSMQR